MMLPSAVFQMKIYEWKKNVLLWEENPLHEWTSIAHCSHTSLHGDVLINRYLPIKLYKSFLFNANEKITSILILRFVYFIMFVFFSFCYSCSPVLTSLLEIKTFAPLNPQLQLILFLFIIFRTQILSLHMFSPAMFINSS